MQNYTQNEIQKIKEGNLYQDAELVQFYDYDTPWLSSYDILIDWIKTTDAILDIGCGTGTMLHAAHKKCAIAYGLDLAAEMLDVAQSKTKAVHWVTANATSFSINQKFDIITLTGHSFQTLLDDESRLALFLRIKEHLSPTGKVIFDSRNPAVEEWKTWTPENSVRYFQHAPLGIIKAWNDVSAHKDIVCYETFYQQLHQPKIWTAKSFISFPSYQQIATLLDKAGLQIQSTYGDWLLNPYQENSEEMIFVCSLGG